MNIKTLAIILAGWNYNKPGFEEEYSKRTKQLMELDKELLEKAHLKRERKAMKKAL